MGEFQKTTFYGTATVGTKGQIVIPADAREAANIKTGDKLVILGLKDRNVLGVCPVESLEVFMNELTAKLETMREVLDTTKDSK